MNVLVFNAGSSSLKFALYRAIDGNPVPLLTGEAEKFAKPQAILQVRDGKGRILRSRKNRIANLEAAAERIIALIREIDAPVPDAIGHRVVHGGPDLVRHCLVDAAILRKLRQAAAFAPLHGPPALSVLAVARRTYRGKPQIACLDTVFHRTMPDIARLFPLPRHFAEQGIYRYGFHGLSCESIVHRLGKRRPARLIIAHLGSGASVTAVKNGVSVDNSMGLTPTGGVMMATRSGDLDPGLLLYLMRKGYSAGKLETLLDRGGGIAGISGLGGDVRDLEKVRRAGAAHLALTMFCYSVRKHIAAAAATLQGVDAVVFTGGIGQHDKKIRAAITIPLRFLGRFRQIVMPAEEEEMIARHTARVVISN